MASTDYLNDPSLVQAQREADTAGTTASNYSSAASLLPSKLREAVMAKVDYNKDIIEQKNKAQAEYFATPSAARAKYNDPTSENYIFNPFQAEKLVAGERAQAYQPYANLTDILGARIGSLSDLVQSGVGGFQAAVSAAQNAAQMARQKFNDLFQLAQAQQSQANTESAMAWDKEKALMDAKSKAGSGGSLLGGGNFADIIQTLFPGLFGGDENNNSGVQEPPFPSMLNASQQLEYPQGSGVIWSGDGKGGWD